MGWVCVVHEEKLSAVLGEFARTMLTDFPIQGILDHLVERIVEVLPVNAAGVTLISPGMAPHYLAASDDSALRWEQLQTELGQGPCLLAYETGEKVSVSDLSVDRRFPKFAPKALEAGLAAVFTFPLRHGDGRLGALDLYRHHIGDLDAENLIAAQTLADVAAAYVLNAQVRDGAREATDRFRQSSLQDSLTGLPNRAMLQQRLEHAAQRARRTHAPAAVLFVDLDRFKRVNDSHGHDVGDQLLCAVAERLSGLVRPGDTLGRVSGDEFVFLCEDLSSPDDIEVLATRIDQAFAAPFALKTMELPITASVGLAYTGPGEAVTDQLVINADIAMYQAKRKGGGAHQIIDLREATQASDRITLEADLANAFAHDKLDIAYQPIVRSSDGVVTGVEALLRWNDPTRGPISTTTMVQIAEQNGLIAGVGAWVLERACRDRVGWLRDHPRNPLSIAVNVSSLQLMGPGFRETVEGVLERTGMDPHALVLEMTEGILIEDTPRAFGVLTGLKALGVRLALDDFGTGYSSLRYLRQFPLDIVKIDQGFIADIGHEPEATEVADAITHLAHVLKLSVTAEGVETKEQHDAVVGIGCEQAQGFYYARPMPAHDVGTQLSSHSRRRSLHLPAQRS
jgi:diguanylate cyclase (GGDEF)-like protein